MKKPKHKPYLMAVMKDNKFYGILSGKDEYSIHKKAKKRGLKTFGVLFKA